MRLKIIRLFLVVGLAWCIPSSGHAASGEAYYGFQPSWVSCTFDSDCVVLRDPCQELAGVNSRSRYAYLRWAEELARSGSVSCGGLQGEGKPEAFCDSLHSRCYIRTQP